MTIEERKQKLVTLGAVIAKELPGFYGNVQFNIQGGKSVYVSITETTKPERQEDV